MACLAYQVTEEDIENVLRAHSLRVADTKGLSFEQMSEELINKIDHERIEKAALKGGCELDEQTQAAFNEIKQNLVELGVLEF